MLRAMGYQHIDIETSDHVGWLWLNRPEKRNALSADMWADIPAAVSRLSDDPEVRVVVVAGRGAAFTVGIDLQMLMSVTPGGVSDAASKQALYRKIRELQDAMTAFERCPKPVIAAVHGWCLGAGVDLITAADIRLASTDAVFGVRETRLGLVADVGTMQRLPRVIARGHVAELVYTGKDIAAGRAREIGLVNDVHPDHDATVKAARQLAEEIAANSPLVVQGVKEVLRAGADLTVAQGLEHVAVWNSAFLQSADLMEAMTAFLEKRDPRYQGQ
jgi:enoyl-CoA hydratase